MSNIYELTRNYDEVLNMLYQDDVDEQMVLDTLESIEGDIEDKADNYAKIMKELETKAKARKEEAQRLSESAKVFENRVKALKSNLFNAMKETGKTRFATNLFSFSIAKNGGKQALTMCMGFGCNAAGVVGCRIIDSPRERLVAMLTNTFVPCNGRFPFLITISSIFFASSALGIWSSIWSTLAVIAVIIIGVIVTLVVSKILSKTILKGMPSSFMLELPPYRTPQFGKILVRSIFDRTLFVLGRAVSIAIPAGIIIWLFANINISGISLLTHVNCIYISTSCK